MRTFGHLVIQYNSFPLFLDPLSSVFVNSLFWIFRIVSFLKKELSFTINLYSL